MTALEGDLQTLQSLCDESDDFRAVMVNPILPRSAVATAVKKIAAKLKMNAITSNFLSLLAMNGRLAALPAIVGAAQAEISKRKGEVVAEITAATPLSDKQAKNLSSALKSVLGSNVQVDIKIDKGILGGMIVRVGSEMIDDSVRTKLDRLERRMKGQVSELSQQRKEG